MGCIACAVHPIFVMASINELRADVLRAQKLAGAKIARVRKATGANVAGSEFDPRRSSKLVARYNARQLRAYEAELNAFRGRNVQFEAGARGTPIPKHLANRFRNVQDSYNAVASRDLDRVAGTRLPGGAGALTIGEREAGYLPESRAAYGRAANRPRGLSTRRVSDIASADSLAILEKDMRQRMSVKHDRGSIARQRMEMGTMFLEIGEDALVSRIGELTNDQFDKLWNYTDIATHVSGRYEALKNMSAEDEANTANDFRSDINELFDWAAQETVSADAASYTATGTVAKRKSRKQKKRERGAGRR